MQKQPEHEMILSYAKPFKEKMRKQFVKIQNKRNIMWAISQNFESMKTKKKRKSECWYKKIQQQPKHNNIYTAGLKACNFIKKEFQRRCFFVKFPKFLRTPFLTEYTQWLLLVYDKLPLNQKMIQ